MSVKSLKEQMRTRSSSQLPEADLNQFSDIELTLEETEEACRLMREAKHYEQIRKDYVERMYAEDKPKIYTAQEMIAAYEKHFIVDDENRSIVEKIAYYFAGDGRFPGDLKKGIYLFGNVGVGKTSMMNFFSDNQRRSYEIVNCRFVEAQYQQKGNPGIHLFSFMARETVKRKGYCFDDLGTEAEITKFYGTPKPVLTEVLLNRYDNGFDFDETHITTNLTKEKFLERYGTRVFDRLPEMFNFIDFTSIKSRRKTPEL